MSKKQKAYWEMTAAELAAATSEFDIERVDAPGEPLTRAQKARHAGAHRGRPVIGKGSERINVTIERGLLSQADKVAKLKGLNRAQLIAIGLHQVISGITVTRRKAGTARKTHKIIASLKTAKRSAVTGMMKGNRSLFGTKKAAS